MVPTLVNLHNRTLLVARDPGSSRTTFIIIVASASAGGVLLALALFRIFWRCCRRRHSRVVPLPPVQPLAHVREQRLTQFIERSDSELLSAPTMFRSGSRNGSKVSLLQTEPSNSSIPSSHTSFGLNDSTQTDFPRYRLSFQDGNSPPGSETGTSTPPETPQSSSLSHNRSVSSTARRNTRSHMGPRPVSMASFNSSTGTSRSGRVRGMPHGPHSNVKIILPTPLASVLHPCMDETLSERPDLSILDKWTPGAVESSGSLKRPSRSLSLERPSFSSPSSRSSRRTLTRKTRSVSSGPSLSARPSTDTPSSRSRPAHAPPVPRIPSLYNQHTTSELESSFSHLAHLEEQEVRGRPRAVPAMVVSRSPQNSRSRQQQAGKQQTRSGSRVQ